MRRIDPPLVDDRRVLAEASAGRHEPARSALIALAPLIETAYQQYIDSLPTFAPTEVALTEAQIAALNGNYMLTYSRGSLHWLRDQILAAAPQGRCPYCDSGQSSTLDHYLPKRIFPQFSILSLNLVPACPRCNNKRGESYNDDANLMWHPYFTDVPLEPILVARIVSKLDSTAAVFEICNPSGIDDALVASFDLLFRELRLGEYFSLESASYLRDLAPEMTRCFAAGGSSAVVDYLLGLANDVRITRGQNSWMTALCDALVREEDFSASHFDDLVRTDVG